jgi:hypothetical protein
VLCCVVLCCVVRSHCMMCANCAYSGRNWSGCSHPASTSVGRSAVTVGSDVLGCGWVHCWTLAQEGVWFLRNVGSIHVQAASFLGRLSPRVKELLQYWIYIYVCKGNVTVR